MQERMKPPLSNVRKAIREVQTGSLDLPRARLIRATCNQWIALAKLNLRAERFGVNDGFFKDAPSVDRSELKRFQNLVKELSTAISG
jgi:hypothetical protein